MKLQFERIACVAYVGWLLGGCSLVLDYDSVRTGESAVAAVGDAGGVWGEAVEPEAETLTLERGGPMIRVTPQERPSFWMDQLEVSRGEFATFLEDEAGHLPGSDECAWNGKYVDIACERDSERIDFAADQPMVCVDQCDAQAYCHWAGKELCHSDRTAAETPRLDDWFAVCSTDGLNAYPFGTREPEGLCWFEKEQPRAVDAGTGCVTPSGIQDLTGNVWEWVGGSRACEHADAADDECLARGGGFASKKTLAQCSAQLRRPRSHTADDLGFRCCAYVTP